MRALGKDSDYITAWLFDQLPPQFYQMRYVPFTRIYKEYRRQHPDSDVSRSDFGRILSSNYLRVSRNGASYYNMLSDDLIDFRAWWRERGIGKGEVWVRLKDIYIRYLKQNNTVEMTWNAIGRAMTDMGYPKKRTPEGVFYGLSVWEQEQE